MNGSEYVPCMDGSSTTDEAIRPRVRLRLANWDRQTSQRGLRTNAECAHLLGTSESTIWRIKEGAVEPGGRFIAAALWGMPGTTFEELFEVVIPKAQAS
jgi:hypothetical protein